MARYEKNPDDEGKYQCTSCIYGHSEGMGKSRQAVSTHYKKQHLEPVVVVEQSEPVFDDSEDDEAESIPIPEWMSIDFDDEDESEDAPVETIPPAVRGILDALSRESGSKGKARSGTQLKAWYKQQAKVVRWTFSGVVDPLVSWWGKGVMLQPDFTIERSDSEWKMFENVSAEWLEYRQISIPVTPDIMMAGCVGAMYIPTVMKIRKNRHPSMKKKGVFSRFRLWRARKKMLKDNALNDSEALDIE